MSKYLVDKIVKSKVTGIEKYGIFVLLDNGYTGLIHISEISDAFVRNISDYVTLGEVISVKILEIDDLNKKMKLSIKNINYRGSKDFNKKICETKHGFSTLKSCLNDWILAKEEEMLKKTKKNNK